VSDNSLLWLALSTLYRLDPEQKDALIEVIEKLLKDQTTVSSVFCNFVGVADYLCDFFSWLLVVL